MDPEEIRLHYRTPAKFQIRAVRLGIDPAIDQCRFGGGGVRRSSPSLQWQVLMTHVIVIDSDPVSRNFANELLTRRGFIPHQASSAAEAIELLASHSYDVALIDLSVTDGDGHRLIDYVRTRHPDVAKHIVVMTSGDPKFANLPEDGWCAILHKPFPASEFNRVVDLCLDGDDAARERQH